MLLLVSITSTLANAKLSSVTFSTWVMLAMPAKSPPISKLSIPSPETSCPLESSTLTLMAAEDRSVESTPMMSTVMPASSCANVKLRDTSSISAAAAIDPNRLTLSFSSVGEKKYMASAKCNPLPNICHYS